MYHVEFSRRNCICIELGVVVHARFISCWVNCRESWGVPGKVEGLDRVRVQAAFASGVISTAVGVDGSLWAWGNSKRGQLGLGKGIVIAVLPTRVEALAGENVVKVSLGWGHALAKCESGKLYGWGYSADGRLGIMGGSETSLLESNADIPNGGQQLEVVEKLVMEGMEKEKDMPVIWEPRVLTEVQDIEVIDVACGLDHTLILCRDNTLLSGGSNAYGQLGRESDKTAMSPVKLSHIPLSISSGLGHSFCICQESESPDTTYIVSWGWNQNHQLGRSKPHKIPKAVQGLEDETPISVSGGRVHSIALTSKGEAWVWGCGKNGRLGLGSSMDETEPCLIECSDGSQILQVSAGYDHSLMLVAD
uniref:RCC1-like domain-containing protein n=1 Tax=Kalanchoe fedtschenkoi TaxID=63787 RepID=A0A7N0TXS6_KALFE